jgi:hypothetical protein
MTYEEFLDEVTTLITELYDVSDAAAIKYVMRAQAEDFFTQHDDDESLRTQERAEQDARTVYAQQHKPPAPTPPKPGKEKRSKKKS